ncbi:hypothetical protein SAMN05519104_0780 [Rhizobiales bacterium GAS188]|nr:hypothetical protein SAMN05519104_0780 [Rhizobiales bacterium GAS188]
MAPPRDLSGEIRLLGPIMLKLMKLRVISLA